MGDRVGIDLLWVRPGKCGGTESFIRNLLNGFAAYGEQEYILFVAKDNVYSFQEYEKFDNFRVLVCPVLCEKQALRILWENAYLDRYACREKIQLMFIPVYSKPHSKKGKIPYVTVIHDLQAIHYPQYFSKLKKLYLKFAWTHSCRTSDCIVTDSDFCKNDILEHFKVRKERVLTVYLPICGNTYEEQRLKEVMDKYGVTSGQYDYCVSSLLPHKNLDTILKVTKKLKEEGDGRKLILSGVGGDSETFMKKLKAYKIEESIIQTGFISNEERDCLYKGCRLFLFPSVFEGFGMPPIEAMRLGKRVVMTKETCLYEVTEGKAFYVEDPYSVENWIKKMDEAQRSAEKREIFPQYDLKRITLQYMDLFRTIMK